MPRPLPAFLATLVLALSLAGASPGRAQTTNTNPSTNPSSNTIVVALGQEPDRLYNSGAVAAQLVSNLVYDPLVGLDDHMQPYADLAAQVPSADNGLIQVTGSGPNRRLEVTMPLRQGVSWSDGVPFTADDVVYMWLLMMNPDSGFDTAVEDKMDTVEKVDDYTVKFVYLSAAQAKALDPDTYRDQGDAPVMDPLAAFGLYDAPFIYPSHLLRQVVGDDPRHSRTAGKVAASSLATAPVGTGPYTLAAWDAGSALTFASRGADLPNRPGRPFFDTVVFRIVGNKSVSLSQLAVGEVQLVTHDALDASDATALDSLPGVQARYTPGNAWEQLTFNLDNPILGDAAVRQAFAAALDRDALNGVALAGKGVVPLTQIPAWSWAFDGAAPVLQPDRARAERLLDGAGWTRAPDGVRQKKGKRLSLTAITPGGSFRDALLTGVRDQLAQVGVELKVDAVPSLALFEATPASPQTLAARQFDLAEFAWVSGYDPGPDQTYTMHSRSVPTRDNAYRGGNYGDYKNPRSDQLLDYVQGSLDQGGRRAAFGELQTLWQADLPVLPLVLRPTTTAASSALLNLRPTPAPAGETWNVEQWRLAPPATPAP